MRLLFTTLFTAQSIPVLTSVSGHNFIADILVAEVKAVPHCLVYSLEMTTRVCRPLGWVSYAEWRISMAEGLTISIGCCLFTARMSPGLSSFL